MAAVVTPIAGFDALNTQIRSVNMKIHPIDMAKDMKVDGLVKPTLHGPAMKYVMQTLFMKPDGTKVYTLPATFAAIGDKKDIIKRIVADERYDLKTMPIQREKHLSGHDMRPAGFYLAQDNGPTDIVVNPQMIITPGSILDPAGKNKSATQKVDGADATLPFLNVQKLGLDTMISGDITCSREGENFKFTMKIYEFNNTGTLEEKDFSCLFSQRTFEPIAAGNPNATYFAGNVTKNTECARIINDAKKRSATKPSEANRFHLTWEEINTIRKYLIMKEIGDTLQVEWLNHIFANNPDIARENTVVGTTDNVVEQRSIINVVGVIKTDNAGTTYTLPRNSDKKALERNLINRLKEEVVSHNISVIEEIKEVRRSLKSPGGFQGNAVGNYSIDYSQWNKTQKENAYNFLTELITNCENVNINLNAEFDTAADITSAHGLVRDNRFKTPFVWNKSDSYFRTVALVRNKIHEKIPFKKDKFVKSNFDAARNLTLMSGGAFAAQTVPSSRRKDLYRISLRNFSVQRAAFDSFKQVAIPPRFYSESISIWSSNADKLHQGFLFCFIRDFHPEILNYALILKRILASIHFEGEDLSSIDEPQTIRNRYYNNVKIQHEHNQSDDDVTNGYFYNKNGAFMNQIVSTQDIVNKMNDYTILCIRLCLFLFNYFPSIFNVQTTDFLITRVKALGDLEFSPGGFLDAALVGFIQQGGGPENSKKSITDELILDIFSSLHQEYQDLNMKYLYEYNLNYHVFDAKIRRLYAKDLLKLAEDAQNTETDDSRTKLIYYVQAKIFSDHAAALGITKKFPIMKTGFAETEQINQPMRPFKLVNAYGGRYKKTRSTRTKKRRLRKTKRSKNKRTSQ
jgi:hypothetical protein